MAVAVVLSGGIGSRMAFGDCPKQYIRVDGRPIVGYVLDAVFGATCVEAVVVVAESVWRSLIISECENRGIDYSFAEPSLTRQKSILNGLREAARYKPADDTVIIHDAARPNVSSQDIDAYMAALDGFDGVMPVLPMNDTVYLCSDEEITGLLERDRVFRGQAPEVFKLAAYLEANEAARPEELAKVRGSSEIAYRMGLSVRIVDGAETNYKITTKSDLDRFCAERGASPDSCTASQPEGILR